MGRKHRPENIFTRTSPVRGSGFVTPAVGTLAVFLCLLAAAASGSNLPIQRIVVDALAFNTPPDATGNSNTATESANVSGNVTSDDDGSGVDSVATLTTAVIGEADHDFSVDKIVDIASVASLPTVLNYTISVTNTGDTGMTGVAPAGTLAQGAGSRVLTLAGPSGDGGTVGTLDPGEVWTYAASHAVTQAEMDDASDLVGSVDVTTAETGATVRSDSATTTITANPALNVTKTADHTANVIAGRVITYAYAVENTGNQTIAGVSLADAHGGSGPAPAPSNETLTIDNAPLGDSTDGGVNGTWDTIAPGDIVTFTATYTVTQNDVDVLQ